MRFLIILFLLAASVADSVDISKVRSRYFDTRRTLVPRIRRPTQGRITNGQPADIGQFPWQVGLSLRFPNGYYWCGGCVLSASWIVTAGHCADGVEEVEVILGTIKSSPTGAVVVRVTATKESVIVHKDYDDWELTDDIALIRLPQPVILTNYIQPVNLPKFTGTAPTYTGDIGVASGWGIISDSSWSISPTLQYADVSVTSNANCATYYGPLPASILCISTETKKSICSGDSGGPLTLKDTKTLIGISSFVSIYGCESGYPAGFSRVSSYVKWIKEHTGVTP